MKNKFFAVHAHFYQPPRQNPWTLVVEKEDGALPYRDFNRKITDECYGPLSIANLKTSSLDYTVSLYSKISFNFGPTLLSWIEDHYPHLYSAILESDVVATRIYGHGSAIAQPYNHRIMPLAGLKDKKLQVKWGLDYFESRFKRKAKGMWLPETAVDNETLETLIEFGIDFTILSPSQAGKTLEGKPITDFNRPYKFTSSSDKQKSISVFYYNKNLADKIITELPNTEKFYLRTFSAFNAEKTSELLSIASDGENYGHHLKNGDSHLRNLIIKIEKEKKFSLCNYSAFLQQQGQIEEGTIVENTAWSCEHGLGRWQKNCGCRINTSLKDQSYRTVLKNFTDDIAKQAEKLYFDEAYDLLKNPEEALLEYSKSINEKKPTATLAFIHSNSLRHLSQAETSKALSLLEMMKNSQFMRTSCAWFFDDIMSIEPISSIKYALKCAETAKIFKKDFSASFEILKKAKSNISTANMEKTLEKLKKDNAYPYIALCEYAFAVIHNYFPPFETHSNYRFKILKEEKQGDNTLLSVSAAEINTLSREIFLLKVKSIPENMFFQVASKESEEQEKHFFLKHQAVWIYECDISSFKNEAFDIAKIFLTKSDKNEKIKLFLLELRDSFCDKNKALKNFKSLKKLFESNVREKDLPFAGEIAKHLINLAARLLPEDENSKELIDFLEKSAFKSTLWKHKLLANKKS